LGRRLLEEAEIAVVLDKVLKVPLVTPTRDGEGEKLLPLGSFWDFIVQFSPWVELLID